MQRTISRRCLEWASLCLVASLTSVTNAQSETSAFAEGEFQVRENQVRRLLRLDSDGKLLSIARSNEETSVEDDAASKPLEELLRLGVDRRTALDLARRRGSVGHRSGALGRHFALLRQGSGSFTQSTSGKKWSSTIRDAQLSASLRLSGKSVQLKLQEKKGNQRIASLEDNGNGEVKLVYSGKDFSIHLTQAESGTISLTRNWDGQTDVFEADNFADLQQKHSELVSSWLVPVLNHAGFQMPITIISPAIQKTVLNRLLDLQKQLPTEFDQLLKALNSDSFQTREAATETLRSKLAVWSARIQREIDSEKLPIETQNRLRILLSQSSAKSASDLVRKHRLLDDPQYLVSLFDIANENETKALVNHLQSITNLDHTNADEWRKSILNDN